MFIFISYILSCVSFLPYYRKRRRKIRAKKEREKRNLSKKSFGLKERKKKLQKNDSVQYCASNYLLHNQKKILRKGNKKCQIILYSITHKVSILILFALLVLLVLYTFLCSCLIKKSLKFLVVYVFIVLFPQSYRITILYCFLLSRIILKGFCLRAHKVKLSGKRQE